MREIRTSGVTRGERVDGSGMRLVRHVRGNPDTELCRRLNAFDQLPYSTAATHTHVPSTVPFTCRWLNHSGFADSTRPPVTTNPLSQQDLKNVAVHGLEVTSVQYASSPERAGVGALP